ncbi:hypothetical protein IAT38_001035 [Cryptococcus sp. DSM 104549]
MLIHSSYLMEVSDEDNYLAILSPDEEDGAGPSRAGGCGTLDVDLAMCGKTVLRRRWEESDEEREEKLERLEREVDRTLWKAYEGDGFGLGEVAPQK